MWMGRPHLRERNVWQPVMVMVSLDSTEIPVDFRLESRIVKEFFGRRSFWTLRASRFLISAARGSAWLSPWVCVNQRSFRYTRRTILVK